MNNKVTDLCGKGHQVVASIRTSSEWLQYQGNGSNVCLALRPTPATLQPSGVTAVIPHGSVRDHPSRTEVGQNALISRVGAGFGVSAHPDPKSEIVKERPASLISQKVFAKSFCKRTAGFTR